MVWTPRTTVAAIVERHGKFLFVEERIDGRAVINQPAGHLEDGESLSEAVRRETLEETRWQIEPLHLIGIYRLRLAEKDRTYLRYCFYATAKTRIAGPLDPDIKQVHWLSMDEFRQCKLPLRSNMVERCLLDHLNGKHYPLDILCD